jgi:hypothetical protein
VLGAVAACIVEPFYVACGFTLYLQRRTILEGWDIELRFRQLAERVEKARRGAAAVAASICVALAIAMIAAPPPAFAQQPTRKASDEIKEVMNDPEFGRKGTRTRVHYVGPQYEGNPDAKPFDWSWVGRLMKWMSELSRAAAWVAAALALVFVLYYLARYVRLHRFADLAQRRPDFLFGLDVRPESLPEDVAGTAEALARESKLREALSLLYRGALVRFMDAGIEFRHGDTESDCMRRVEAAERAARKAYFRQLVDAWQSLAYGHQPVEPSAVAALARGWREHFSTAPPRGPEPQAQPA